MAQAEAMPTHEPVMIERVVSLAPRVRAIRSEVSELRIEQVPVERICIVPGMIHNNFGVHSGKPSFYYVRTETGHSGRGEYKGSFEEMVRTVLGEKNLEFRADCSNTPEELLARAEALKAKLEDPAIQRKIRATYAEITGLKKSLLDR
jgi:hypothetical protein